MTVPSLAGAEERRRGTRRAAVAAPGGPDRLLAGVRPDGTAVGLDEHLDRFGPLPHPKEAAFLDELDRSGLRGHGGAWFPVGTKWRSVKRGLRGAVVVANAAEGEPASGKDRMLVHQQTHLVLDGAVLAAQTLGASQVYVHVPAGAVGVVDRAIDERRRFGLDSCTVETVVAPDRFLAGQETAVVSTISGRRPATPTFAGFRTIREQGVGGRPTLVQNVETLAHAALVARFGSAWFRSVGTTESPGTALLTVTGRWPDPRIVEAPLGIPLAAALQLRPDEARGIQGVLLGGYGGGWVTTGEAMSMSLTEEAARALGSSIGAGVVALVPSDLCPLAEVSRVVNYLEGEGAGQCGPCVNGLSAIARRDGPARVPPEPAARRPRGNPHPLRARRGPWRLPPSRRRRAVRAHRAQGLRRPRRRPPPARRLPSGRAALPAASPYGSEEDGMTKRPGFSLVVDPIACDGHGVCAELFPEGIRLDPWGFPIMPSDEIPQRPARPRRTGGRQLPAPCARPGRTARAERFADQDGPPIVAPMRTVLGWSLRLAVLALVLAALGRLLRSRGAQPEGGLFPSIVGDTWPPVPPNPDREA